GNCVIVGRCSDFILNELDYAVHIYIYAPFPDRVAHCMEELEIGEEAALRQVTETEESRVAYHLNYTGFRPDDTKHKDILINSSLLGVEGTARLLAQMVRQRFHLPE
ncbi:MAG: AAA family ATPase, partial [Faecousia sp.]